MCFYCNVIIIICQHSQVNDGRVGRGSGQKDPEKLEIQKKKVLEWSFIAILCKNMLMS